MTTIAIVLRCSILCLVSVLLASAGAQAQQVERGPAAAAGPATNEADNLVDAIIVTGSRIRRDPLSNDSPIVVLDQTAITQTGLSAIADVLQRLPSAAGGLSTNATWARPSKLPRRCRRTASPTACQRTAATRSRPVGRPAR